MSNSKLFTFLLIFLSLSAIFCFYNFDSASAYTGTITYDSGTNTITCVGGSSSTPIKFDDIYQADLAGGWGVVSKSGFTSADWVWYGGAGFYFFNHTKIVFGDGNELTYFTDYDKEVLFNTVMVSGEFITIKNYSIVNFGYLVNATTKTTTGGITFKTLSSDGQNTVIIIENNAEVNFYSCTLGGAKRYDYGDFNTMSIKGYCDRIWSCKFFGSFVEYLNDCDIYNCDFENKFRSDKTAIYEINNCNIVNIYVTNSYGVVGGDYFGSQYFYNIVGIENNYINYPSNSGSDNYYFIDCSFDNWKFRYPYDDMEGKHYRQYTFNLNVLNGEITDFVQNANVTLYKDNVKVYSGLTNSSGMIPTQTLTYGYYQQATGDSIQNATSPYYLVITHPDWQTYISRFYITQPLRLTVSMQEPTYTGYTEVEKSDYTTIILFIISLILCIIGLALTVPLLPLIALTVSVINVLLLTEISMFNILLIILNIIFTVITIVRSKTKNN